jgi:uncharacterized membrane protein YGL010W
MTESRSAQRLTRILASYGRFHRDARNRLTHYFGVPAIIYAILVPLALSTTTAFGAPMRLDRVLIVVAAAGYLLLDPALGASLALVLALLAAAAEATLSLGPSAALTVAGIVFVAGWALQLLGHRMEGNRPALLTNLAQVLVAPLYLMAELGFALGLRRELAASMERRLGDAPRRTP